MTKNPGCIPYNIASYYEDQTVKLSVKTDGLIFSALSLDKACRKIASAVSMQPSASTQSIISKSRDLLYEELITTLEELISLKQQVREIIAAVIQSPHASFSDGGRCSSYCLNPLDESDKRPTACSCDFFAKCVSVLKELDRDLLSTQNLIEMILNDPSLFQHSARNMLQV